jgi:hypothetical protein
MTFNVEEKHAVGGAGAAMVVPTVVDMVGLDDLLVSLADAVFEGDRGSAAFVTGIGSSVIGAAMILGAILSDIDDWLGVIIAGLGVGFGGVGLRAFGEGGA